MSLTISITHKDSSGESARCSTHFSHNTLPDNELFAAMYEKCDQYNNLLQDHSEWGSSDPLWMREKYQYQCVRWLNGSQVCCWIFLDSSGQESGNTAISGDLRDLLCLCWRKHSCFVRAKGCTGWLLTDLSRTWYDYELNDVTWTSPSFECQVRKGLELQCVCTV